MAVIGRIASSTFRALKYVAKKTSFGQDLEHIKDAAMKARGTKLETPEIDLFEKAEEIFSTVKEKGEDIADAISRNREFSRNLRAYNSNSAKNFRNLASVSGDVNLKMFLESGGVGLNKVFQTISSDEKLLAKLPEGLRKIIQDTKSHNTPTRTLQEAQEELSKRFGTKYAISDNCGVGTIGEAYSAKDMSGKEFVAKGIKKGLTKEQLDTEEYLAVKVVKHLSGDATKAEQNEKAIRELYSKWKQELDFNEEARNNELLAKNAKRYHVAKIVEVSKDGKWAIYEKAQGIQADKFIQMTKEFKQNPSQYYEKYREIIAKNPWMKNPLGAMSEATKNLIKAFDEMFLFAKKGGKSIMHGDPHTGNFFINKNLDGKITATFIDTGNCCERTINDISRDLQMFSNYFVGNARGVAEYYVKQAETLPKGKTQEQLISDISKALDEKLFKSGQNISEATDNQKVIDKILEENGIYLNMAQANQLKASLQFTHTIKEMSKINGASSAQLFTMLIPDVLKGVATVSLHTNPFKIVKPAVTTMVNDKERAFGTLFQIVS